MKRLLTTLAVSACGLITSLITVLIITVISRLTGFDLFGFNLWFIVPIGAGFCGFAAASGYYFGSLYFHTRPSLLLFLQMVIIAGLSQILVYYLQYYTMVLDDGRRVSDFLDFTKYLDISITT